MVVDADAYHLATQGSFHQFLGLHIDQASFCHQAQVGELDLAALSANGPDDGA